MTAQVTSDYHGNNGTALEGMLSKHHELKTEVDTMRKNYENLDASGENLLREQHYASEIITEKLEELRTSWSVLLKSWEDRTEELQKRKKAENMNREVTQLEAWLLNQEAELSLNEVGNCLENVEDLLKRHDEVERMLHAQEERFLGLIHSSDDEEGYNVAIEENEGSVIVHVDDLTATCLASEDIFSANNNYDTADISEISELNSTSSPDNGLTSRSLDSDDFSTSTAEVTKLSELSSMPDLSNFDFQGEETGGRIIQSDQLPKLNLAASEWTMDQSDDDTKLTEDAAMLIDGMTIGVGNDHAKADVPDTFVDKASSETMDYGSTRVIDEYPTSSTSTDVFNERIKTNSPKLQNKKSLYKEPMSASNRILGVSPLCSGMLQRKRETDISGQRSVAQPWRSYYTVLSEDILQFFKDLEGFKSKWHVSKPMSLVGSFCEQVRESSRQGYIFRVIFRDKSEYLFATENEEECKLWMMKINSVIKMAARCGSSSGGDGHVYYGDNSHNGHDDAYGHIHHRDGDSDGAGHDNSDDLHSDNDEDDGSRYGQVYHGDSDGTFDGDRDDRDSDNDGRGDIDDIKPDDKNSNLNNLKKPHSDLYNSSTPMIVITDTNSNNEFLVEDDIYTDTHSSSDEDAQLSDVQLSDKDMRLSDEDTMSLPEYSDYEQPSWYPTPNSGSLDHNDAYPVPKLSNQDNGSTSDSDSFETPPPSPSSPPPSYPDPDSIAPPGKPSTRVFKTKDSKEDNSPPPVPSTPPPSIPVSDIESNLPSDLPESFPPEATDDNLSDLLDFIPPPVLDPSFDFLEGTKDEVKFTPSTRPQPETKSDPSTSSRFSSRRIAPPPPPRPSMSLLSDMDLPISIQTERKQHERKDEKKGLFSGIFKRKK